VHALTVGKARAAAIFALVAAMPWRGVADEPPPIHTFNAFNATIYYRYTCVKDVFTLGLGAESQLPAGGEASLYWEIWDSDSLSSGAIEPVAELNTLPIAAIGTPLAGGFPGGSAMLRIPRACAGQSLYLWAASAATRLPDGTPAVQFSNAAERPLPLPT
jgi:hypothetical protein